MKGLAKRTLLVLVAIVIGLIGFAAIACGGDEEKPKPPATKPVTYYGELSGVEYKLVVNGSTYTLLYDSTGRAGKIAIDGNNVTLTFTDGAKEKVTGTKDGTVITITYNEAELKLYEDITYTVKFETGSGSAVSSQSVRNGKKASKPTDPTPADKYSFVGWYTDNTYKTAYDFSTQIVTGDVTLYARWLPIPNEVEYTVAFDLNYAGAAKLESKETIGGMVIDAPVPTREGYEFKGWWISMTGEKNNGAPVLSYQLKAETVLEENTTAYAVWQTPATAGDKLPAPIVDVNGTGISWQSVGMTANGYQVNVTGPNNYSIKDKTELTTSMAINFAELPAGDYTITVVARSSAGQDKYSEPTVRVYRNKALARVSKFEVKDESLLVYNKVKNATKYNVYVECGNETHKHNPLDNGNKDNYEFANCGMREEGLNFYVEAVADGYATSRSEVFNYDRRLDAIAQTELTYTEATETVSWKAVNKATGYVVKIGDIEKTITGTSVDLRELNEGNIKVVVRPIANNYNSPKATEITVNKKTLATPANVRIEGMLVKWDAVKTAAKYTVEIAGKTYDVTGTQLDLSDKGLTLTTGAKYSVTVKSVNGNKQSINSVAVEAEYNAMSGALTYDTNSVKWQYVFGATAYDVRVNEGAVTRVTGTNSARIKLTKEGDNKVQVRWYLVGSETPSAWKDLTVKAYALSYDLNGADGALATQYYAEGDEISLYAAADIATEKVGHMFNGWYTSTDDNAQLFENDLYNAKANTKLYANWKARTYTVTLNYNELGSDTRTTADVVFGEAYTIAPPAEISDGTLGFVGWYRSTDEKSMKYTDEYGNSISNWNEPGSLTLYAQYRVVLSFVKQSDGTYWVEAGAARGAAKTITIPATYEGGKVTTIGKTAFDSARNLENLMIPASIEGIDLASFQNVASIKNIEIYSVEGVYDEDAKYRSKDGVLFYNNTSNEGGGSIDVWAYPRGKQDEVYELPDFVTNIPLNAFYYSQFEEIIIPTSVRDIRGTAFFKTNNLTTVTFKADSTHNAEAGGELYKLHVAAGAFGEAPNINKMTLPARLADNADGSFNVEMFCKLYNLETIELDPASKYQLTDDGMIYLPASGGIKAKLVFCPAGISGKDGEVTISDKVEVVGTHAFSGTRKLTSITIPANITTLEAQSFSGYRAFIEGSNSGSSYYDYSGTWATKIVFAGNRLVGLTIGDSAFGYGYKDNAGDNTQDIYSYTACTRLAEIVFEPGCNVIEIGNWAFAGCNSTGLTSITIPNSVTKIGNYAFRGCIKVDKFQFEDSGDGELDLTKSLTVGSNIFYDCSKLTEITLPYYFSLEADEDGEVNSGLFAGCINLENVYVDGRSPYLTSEDGVLFNKNKTAIYFYPLGREGDYDLPDTVEIIGAGVFANKTNLTGITIHNKVTKISARAFEKCTGLLYVTFEGTWSNDVEVQAGAFKDCDKLATITFPTGLKSIADSLFSGCKGLVSVNIPSTVTYIGKEAFMNCELFKGVEKEDGTWELVIPKAVTDLGYQAFYNCKALTNVVFEDGRTTNLKLHGFSGPVNESSSSKTSYQFGGCTSLESVTFVNKMPIIGGMMFYGCTVLDNVNIPADVTYIGPQAFQGCKNLTVFTFTERTGNNPTPLELGGGGNSNSPFGSYSSTTQNTKIQNLVLPRGTKRIPRYAFAGLTSLQTVWIPNTVTNGTQFEVDDVNGTYGSKATDYGEAIGAYAFYNCTGLNKVEFESGGSGVFALGQSSFSVLSLTTTNNLHSVQLPSRLAAFTPKDSATARHVIDNAFNNRSKLSSVTVAGGGKYIGRDGMVFESTDKGYILVFCPIGKSGDITLDYDVIGVTNYAFYNNPGITSIKFNDVPTNVSTQSEDEEGAGDEDDTWPYALTLGSEEVTVSVGLANTAAFYNMKQLKSVSLPARLKAINQYAFNLCEKLETLTFAENCKVVSIGDSAFIRCKSLTEIDLPDSLKTIGDSAFDGLTKLGKVTIGKDSKLSAIGDYAFRKTNIESIYIPDKFSATGFGTGVFMSCSKLSSVSIPDTISSVDGVFTSCAKLSGVTIRAVGSSAAISGDEGLLYTTDANGKKTLVYSTPGYKGDANGVCVVPDGVIAIAIGAFANNGFIKEVRIPTTVGSIGDQAFYKCWSLEKVSFYDTEIQGAAAQELTIGNYAFDGDTALSSVQLPRVLSSIGDYAFQNTYSLKSVTKDDVRTNAVTFADNCLLQTIGSYAFYYSGIDYISLPTVQLTTIGDYAFRYSGLKEITIPNCVTNIGIMPTGTSVYTSSYVFANCASLKKATFASGGSKPLYVQQWTFYSCKQLDEVTLCSRLQTIAPSMFRETAITSITIPKAVTQVAGYAFQDCKQLETVVFEDGSQCNMFGHPLTTSYTTASSKDCFKNSGLKTINIPALINNTTNLDPSNFAGTQLTTVKFESGNRTSFAITKELFKDLTTLTTVTLPSDLATINEGAFKNTGITKITIPASVKSVGKDVFFDCSKLKEVIFDEGTTLTTWWGSTVTAAAAATNVVTMFQGCTSLEKVVMPAGIKHLGINLFKGLKNLEEVELQEDLLTISEGAFYGSGIRGITIPSTVTTIGFNAFRDCANLGKAKPVESEEGEGATIAVLGVVFESSTTALTTDSNAFYNSGLTSIVIPARLTTLGASALADCKDLTSVTFEANSKLATIGNNAFWGTGITAITLPGSVTSIGNYAFRSTKLAAIEIPGKVASIGANPFAYCDLLATITVASDNAKFAAENNVLYNNDKTVLYVAAPKGVAKTFVLADSVTDIAAEAFLKSEITSLTIGDNVVIGVSAFMNNNALAEVTLGDGVTADIMSFASCAALTTVTIGENVNLEVRAFYDCDLLENVIVGVGANFGTRVFENCDALLAVNATEVASIGLDMFKDCDNEVTLGGAEEETPVKYKGFELKYDEDNEYWYVYVNGEIGTKFVGDVAVDHVVIGSAVTAIPDNAFNGCSNLQTLVMEEGETAATIGASAFANCSSLKYLKIAKRVTTIGDNVLKGSNNTEEIVTPFVGNKRAPSTANVNTANSRSYIGIWYGITSNTTAVSAAIKKLTITDCQYVTQYALCIPSLEELILPDDLTALNAGGSSYSSLFYNYGTKVRRIDFGNSITAFPNYVTSACAALEEIVLPATVESTTTNTFTGTTALTKVYYKGTLDQWAGIAFGAAKSGTPYGNSAQGELYIDGEPVTEGIINIAAGTTAITGYKFYGLKGIIEINVPASVTNYGTYAFSMCPDLTTVVMATPETTPTIGANLFDGSQSLSSVTLPDNIVTVGNYMFRNCKSLEEITLPSMFNPTSATTGTYMFDGSGLTSVTIPSATALLANYMFTNCNALHSVILPATVKTYGSNIFLNCTALETVEFKTGDTAPTIGANMFDGCTALSSVTLPTNLVTVGNYMFRNCTSLQSITLPDTFNPCNVSYPDYTTTGINMFQYSGLTSITLPASMTVINNYMFADCAELTSVTIPEGIRLIGTNVFQNCVRLTEITIPDSVTGIGANTFQGCTTLTNVKLSENLATMGNYIFDGCAALEEIVIPESVISIGSYAFRGCTAMNSIIIPSTVITLGANCFNGWTEDKTINTTALSPMPEWSINWYDGCEASIVWGYEPPKTEQPE